MTMQLSVAVRNAEMDAIETAIGASAVLQLRSGAAPANCAAADAGTLLCQIDLPADYLAAAAAGAKTKIGTWSGTGAAGAGTGTNVAHFRIKDSAATTTHIQGTVTATAGGGDMTMDNVNIAQNQAVTVNSFSLTAGNP